MGFSTGFLELIVLIVMASVLLKRKFILFNGGVYLLTFLVILVSSSLLHSLKYNHFESVIIQFFVYMKMPLVALIISSIAFLDKNYTMKGFLLKVVKLLLLLSFLLCLIQIIAIDLIISLFKGMILNSFVNGTELRRLTGIFYHPTPLAFFSALSFFFLLSNRKIMGFGVLCFYLAISILLIMLSGQRGEILFLLLSAMIVYFFKDIKITKIKVLLLTVLSSFLLYVVIQYFASNLIFTDETIARLVLYSGANYTAVDLFPFGSGAATYGSANSLTSSLYDALGISELWWFVSDANYLTDTFWAMILAESGWLGVLFYLAFLISFMLSLCKSENRAYQYASVLFVSFETITNPVFTGASFLNVFALLIIFYSGVDNEKQN